MSKKKSMYNMGDALLLKNDMFQVSRYYDYYSCLGLNRFRWKNLPSGMESRHIERALFENGQAVFFKDDDLNSPFEFLCLPCQPSNALNVYGDPVHFNGIGNGAYYTNLSPLNSVRIMDNDNALPPQRHIRYYTYLMTQIELTINMNLDQQKFPMVMPTTKKNELSMRRIYEKYAQFDPLMLVDEKLANQLTSDGDGFKAINTSAPYLLDKLCDFKKTVENELLTFLGINNNNTDKKERLLMDEVNANNSFIDMSLDFAYKERLRACEKINKLFGLNIQVEKVVNILDDERGEEDDKNDLGNDGE